LKPSLVIDTIQSSNIVVVDTTLQVNLNTVASNTIESTDVSDDGMEALHRTTHIFPISLEPSTAFTNRIDENNITDNNSVTSDIEIASTNQDDDENYLSIAEINETSIISDIADLHSSHSIQPTSISVTQHTPILHAISNIENDEHAQDTIMDDDVPPLLDDDSEDDIDHKISILQRPKSNVIPIAPTNIQPTKTPRKNEHTERTDNIHRKGRYPISKTLSSATSQGKPTIKVTTSDNLKMHPKLHKDSSTARTVRFDKQDDSIPTVSVMQNPPQIKVTHVPLIHSVMLCTNPTSTLQLLLMPKNGGERSQNLI
jgi:hypothetical protein